MRYRLAHVIYRERCNTRRWGEREQAVFLTHSQPYCDTLRRAF
jgi:hypothetical protein